MLLKIKKNGLLIFGNYKFRCALGKAGTKKNKKEGDKATPRGIFTLGKIYYRSDRIKKIETSLKVRKIRKNMGWCHDPKNSEYNREINLNLIKEGENLFRRDHKYDLFIEINYNSNPVIPNKGSAIFLHLTKNFEPTAGCIAINLKDFLILAKLIKPKTKIKIK